MSDEEDQDWLKVPEDVLEYLSEQPQLEPAPVDWQVTCDSIFIYKLDQTYFVNWAIYNKTIAFEDAHFFVESKASLKFATFEAAIAELLRKLPFQAGVDYHVIFGEGVKASLPLFANVTTAVFDEQNKVTFNRAI